MVDPVAVVEVHTIDVAVCWECGGVLALGNDFIDDRVNVRCSCGAWVNLLTTRNWTKLVIPVIVT